MSSPLHRTLDALIETHGPKKVMEALADLLLWKSHHFNSIGDQELWLAYKGAGNALKWLAFKHGWKLQEGGDHDTPA